MVLLLIQLFFNELEKLKKNKILYKNNLFISRKAHLILPTHRYLDAASELAKGKKKLDQPSKESALLIWIKLAEMD